MGARWKRVGVLAAVAFAALPGIAAAQNAPVSGSVPPALSLTVGGPVTLGPFLPGVAKDYSSTTTANVISTGGDGMLSVSDPSATNVGKMTNGSYALASPLQAGATSAGGVGGALAPITASTPLLTYTGPVSNDTVTLTLKQSIGVNEALRTGAYAKSLVFTLSTTTP